MSSSCILSCKHEKTLSYQLTNADMMDFSKRLEVFLGSSEHEFATSFLTPSIRGHRARSMLHTCKTSTTKGTTGSKLIETNETEGDYPSDDKRRSSVRASHKQPIHAPTSMQNCFNCGAIYFRVSPSHIYQNRHEQSFTSHLRESFPVKYWRDS